MLGLTPYALTKGGNYINLVDLGFLTFGELPDWISYTRANTAMNPLDDGGFAEVAADTPRLNGSGLLIEPPTTNLIDSDDLTATPATLVGIGWDDTTSEAGVSYSVVAQGTVDGLDYVDIRFQGTPTGSGGNLFFSPSQPDITELSSDDVFSSQLYIALVGGDLTNVTSIHYYFFEATAAGAYDGQTPAPENVHTGLTSTLQLKGVQNQVWASGNADATQGSAALRINYPQTGAVDFTLRLASPQFEAGVYRTTFVGSNATSNARSAETITVTAADVDASNGDILRLNGTDSSGAPWTEDVVFAAGSASFTRSAGEEPVRIQQVQTLPAPAAPANTSAPAITGTARVGQTLSTTSNGVWTGNPAPTFAHQWRRDGVDISGATGTTYTLVLADLAASIDVEVTATNSEGSATANSNDIGPIEAALAAPVNTVLPVISGTTTVGQTLTCSEGTWTGNPTPTYSYQWFDDAVAISGATSSTYLLTASETGGTITCRVTATNSEGSTNATSAGVGPVASAPAAPVNTVAPVISGTTEVGQTLTSTAGTWTGNPTPTYAYQWLDDAVAIPGATSATYLLTSSEVGGTITCRVTATNSEGSADATSAGVGPVTAAAGGAWAPSDDASLSGWWDASDSANHSPASGSVSTLTDLSSNSNDFTQATGAAQPQTGGSINGVSALTFDGVDDVMSVAGVPAASDSIAVLMVFDFVAGGTHDVRASALTTTAEIGNFYNLRAQSTTNYDMRSVVGYNGSSITGSNLPYNDPVLVAVLHNGSGTPEREMRINGTSEGTSTGQVAMGSAIEMDLFMANAFAGRALPGQFGELVATTDLTVANLQKHEGYLAHKWGLEGDLPADHPYKSAAPTV